MRRGGWITGLGCMAPFIAAGLWLGWQIDLPIDVRLAVNSLIGRDRLYPVLVNGKVGYIECEGKLIVPARYESTGRIGLDAVTCPTPILGEAFWMKRRIAWAKEFSEGYGAVKTSGGWHMIDAAGRELLAKPVDGLGDFQLGLAWFKEGGTYGLLDRAGKVRVPASLGAAPEFWDGLWKVQSNGFLGLLDSQGRQLTGMVYQRMREPSDGLIAVQRGGKWGYVDFTGREVIKCQFDYAGDFSQGRAVAMLLRPTRKRLWIDKKGQAVAGPAPSRPAYDDGLYLTAKGNLFGLTDSTGKWVATPMYKFIGTLDCSSSRTSHPTAPTPVAAGASLPAPASATLVEQWEEAVQKLKDIYRPSKPRLAVVQTADDKWGVMDIDGRLRCQGLDESIVGTVGLRFSEGLARVTRDGKVGFVDETGRIVIEPQFDYAEDFSGGLSRFITGVTRRQLWGSLTDANTARWGYIDRTGRIVWQPTR